MDTYQLTVYALIAGFVLIFWKAAQWAMTSARARGIRNRSPRRT